MPRPTVPPRAPRDIAPVLEPAAAALPTNRQEVVLHPALVFTTRARDHDGVRRVLGRAPQQRARGRVPAVRPPHVWAVLRVRGLEPL